jgi:hypothetical protein
VTEPARDLLAEIVANWDVERGVVVIKSGTYHLAGFVPKPVAMPGGKHA